jgi:hypothetical protein
MGAEFCPEEVAWAAHGAAQALRSAPTCFDARAKSAIRD